MLRSLPRYSLTMLAVCSAVMITSCSTTKVETSSPDGTATPDSAPSCTSAASEAASASPQLALTPNLVIKPVRKNGDTYANGDDVKRLAQTIATAQSLPVDWVLTQLAQARYREAVAKLIMPSASSTAKNWGVYKTRFVEPIRIRAGQAFSKTYAADLKRAEQQYGVPVSIIAGVLGVETIYGRQTGNFKVLDVLTTLSLDFPSGRSDRSEFFRSELAEFLRMCFEQKLETASVLGSYAGAIGWPQFMPSSIRHYAVDFDGDGRIDLQRSPVDAIGSVAHYLAAHGWQASKATYFDVTPPSDMNARAKLLEPDILPTFTATQMRELGTELPPEADQHDGPLALVQLLNGGDTPTMIAGTANFYAITRYNQSSYYALAVIQLGQAVATP